jgi:hypothetical protein
MFTMPKMRLTLDHMRQEVIFALQKHSSEVEEAVSKMVDEYVENGQLEEDVRQAVARHMSSEVEGAVQRAIRGWLDGGSARTVITEAVEHALNKEREYQRIERGG